MFLGSQDELYEFCQYEQYHNTTSEHVVYVTSDCPCSPQLDVYALPMRPECTREDFARIYVHRFPSPVRLCPSF